MENKKYALWYIDMFRCLRYMDYIGTIEECLRELESRDHLRWVIRPYVI